VPYASSGWRPYTQGHWIYTQYGPTWSGYEPWAWAAYHYGNWIFTSRYGWVWIPGYDWHPGRVSWARGYDTIGWTPLPPTGYDYSRGYLSYVGNDNQFSYYDDDFDYDDYNNGYSYGGPYYDPRYRDNYYNSSYQNISINLWIFVGNNYFGYDNYADYYLPPDYCRYAFDRRMIRISNRPVDRRILERIVKQRIQEVPVEVREIETDKRRIKMIVPIGQEEKIRKNANLTVRNVIAPAFAEKQKVFKGEKSKNKVVIDRIFKQENVRPRVETVSSDVLIEKARVAKKDRDEKRVVVLEREKEKVEKVEKEGKIRGPKKVQETEQKNGPGNQRDAQFENEKNKKQKNDLQETPGNRDKNKKDEEAVSNSGKDRDSQFDTEKKKKKDTEESQRNQHGNSRDSQSENEDKAKDNKAKGPSNSSDSQLNQGNKKEPDATPSGESENPENVRNKKDQSEQETVTEEENGEDEDADQETVTEEENGEDKDSDKEDTKSKKSKSKNKGKSSKSTEKDKEPSDDENKPPRH